MDYNNQPGQKAMERRQGDGGEPLVSIITPFFNAHEFFEQTFQCVMNQTFPWYEWIIVDDGSTEQESMLLLEELPKRDKRIRVIHQKNKRQAAARNTGVRNARAEVILPLDADDLIAPTYIERTFFGLYFCPEAAWCYTDSVGFGEQCYEWIKPFSSEQMKTENILTCTAAIRLDAFEEVGGYTEAEEYYDEDWEFWLKLLKKGYTPVHLPEPASFWYRRSSEGMQKTVQHDAQLKEKSRKRIAEIAESVDGGITAKCFPCGMATGKYPLPCKLAWTRKVWPTQRKKHILFLLPWLEMGGADLFYLDVIRRLDQERYSVTVVTTQQAENKWKERFEAYTADVLCLPSFVDEENYAAFISYIIQSRGTDLLFLSNSYYGYMAAPWLRMEFPEMAIVDYVHMEEWYWRRGGYARTSGMLSHITEMTLVCNEATREVMLQKFGRDPQSVRTLYIGVDHEHFNPDTVQSGEAQKEQGIAPHRPIILFPCRVHPQKRPFLMLEVAKQVHQNWPEAAFLVVGDGSQLDELKIKVKQCALEECVYFAGRQSDMRPYYKDATMTLICSIKEGLALTAYESLAMKTPVITSDVGGQAELIDGSVGAVVPLIQNEGTDLDERTYSQEEIDQYVQAICRIGSLEGTQYAALCERCRRRIIEGFSQEKMIARLQSLFEELTGDERKREAREKTARDLAQYRGMTEELISLYSEIDAYEYMYKHHFAPDTKNELMRLAHSKWGARLIKLMFKTGINKLFR